MKRMYLLLLALLPLGMMAQDDDGIGPFTEPVHAWLWPLSDLCVDSVKQSKDRRWKGYRVLGYEHAAFGVLFTSCWDDLRILYYDTLAHALVYKQQLETTIRNPKMTTRMTIPDGHLKLLTRLWSGAVSRAKYPETSWVKCRNDQWDYLYSPLGMCLDGENSEFFFHEKCAWQECSEGHGRVEFLIVFTKQLMEAVISNKSSRVDSLMTVAEFLAPMFDGLNCNNYDHETSFFVLPPIMKPIAHLKNLTEAQHHEYLTKKAAEVTDCFSSGYTPAPPVEYEVSDLKTFNTADFMPQSREQKGRKFYEVIIRYVPSAQKSWPFQAKVAIWEDDGEPLGIIFGNHFGHNFFVNPYHEWVKHNITQPMPLP